MPFRPDQDTDTARFVVSHPQHYCDRPHLYRTAWIALKHAAGQTVAADTLGPSRHHQSTARVPALVADLESRRGRISARIRARAAELELRPHDDGPDGGNAA